MKTFSKIAVLFPLVAAACGGSTQSPSSYAVKEAERREVECSVSMDARSTALEVQQYVAAVLDGSVDPCGGAVDLRAASVAFVRIEPDTDGKVRLVFNFIAHDNKPYNIP